MECKWVTEAIREGIKKRRELNRKARNSIGREKEKWEREWRNQKIRVQIMVRESKEAWEQEQVKEIWTCKNRGKQLWKHINKLRGKDKDEEDLEFYENGRKMEFEEGWNGFVENWIRIYQMREDNIKEVWEGGWSEGLKNRYEETLFWEELEDTEPMRVPEMGEDNLIKRIEGLKKIRLQDQIW